MLSGIGPADHLAERDIPVVDRLPGAGLGPQDHPSVLISLPVVRGSTWLDAFSEENRALCADGCADRWPPSARPAPS
ncbi:hypothetical protein ACWEQ2_30470 [Streptomyces sp. NPDC004096]